MAALSPSATTQPVTGTPTSVGGLSTAEATPCSPRSKRLSIEIPPKDPIPSYAEQIPRILVAKGFEILKSLPTPAKGWIAAKENRTYILKISPLSHPNRRGLKFDDNHGEPLIRSLPRYKRINTFVQRLFFGEGNLTRNRKENSEYVLDISPFINGKDLFEVLGAWEKRREPLPLEKAINYAIQMGKAIHFLHCHGVVYRDVKPDNFIVDQVDNVHLVDMEFARRIEDGPMTPLGTGDYLAPEYFKHPPSQNFLDRVDSFAFGVTLHILLTGYLPYDPEQREAFISKGTPSPYLNSGYIPHKTLLKLVMDLMQYEPGKRPTVGEATKILMQFQKTLP